MRAAAQAQAPAAEPVKVTPARPPSPETWTETRTTVSSTSEPFGVKPEAFGFESRRPRHSHHLPVASELGGEAAKRVGALWNSLRQVALQK